MIEKALKLTREFHRMKQGELANRLGISASYLSEIESGKKQVTLDLLEEYARVFDVPASTFMLFRDEVVSPSDEGRRRRAGRLLKFFEWVAEEERHDDSKSLDS